MLIKVSSNSTKKLSPFSTKYFTFHGKSQLGRYIGNLESTSIFYRPIGGPVDFTYELFIGIGNLWNTNNLCNACFKSLCLCLLICCIAHARRISCRSLAALSYLQDFYSTCFLILFVLRVTCKHHQRIMQCFALLLIKSPIESALLEVLQSAVI